MNKLFLLSPLLLIGCGSDDDNHEPTWKPITNTIYQRIPAVQIQVDAIEPMTLNETNYIQYHDGSDGVNPQVHFRYGYDWVEESWIEDNTNSKVLTTLENHTQIIDNKMNSVQFRMEISIEDYGIHYRFNTTNSERHFQGNCYINGSYSKMNCDHGDIDGSIIEDWLSLGDRYKPNFDITTPIMNQFQDEWIDIYEETKE